MDFTEIEALAHDRTPLPKQQVLSTRLCYACLRYLYADYRAGNLDNEQAAREKTVIRREYETLKAQEVQQFAFICQTQDSIKRAGTLRSDLNKGLRDGEPADKLLPLAVEIFRRMAGETVMGKAVPFEQKENRL